MNKRINIGDKVTITLFMSENAEKSFSGIVEYMPAQTGDIWIITDTNGNLRYVRDFVQIIKHGD